VLGIIDPLSSATAHPSTDPLVQTTCPDANEIGYPYQELSRQTGGFRYSICGVDLMSAFTHLGDALVSQACP
jgi:hypothetical protein